MDKTSSGYLNREDLSYIPELSINPLGSRIVQILLEENGQLNFRNFVKILSTFRRGKNHDNKDNKLKFLFKVNILYFIDIKLKKNLTKKDL